MYLHAYSKYNCWSQTKLFSNTEIKCGDLLLILSPKEQVCLFFATPPLRVLKKEASATPPKSVFPSSNSPSAASVRLRPVLSPNGLHRTGRETEALDGSEAQGPPGPCRPPLPSIPFLSLSSGPSSSLPNPSPSPLRRAIPSAFPPPPLRPRKTREPSASLPSRRSASRGSSATPVATAMGSAVSCVRLAARGRRRGSGPGRGEARRRERRISTRISQQWKI